MHSLGGDGEAENIASGKTSRECSSHWDDMQRAGRREKSSATKNHRGDFASGVVDRRTPADEQVFGGRIVNESCEFTRQLITTHTD
jgi:hypothetical protein